MSAIAVFMWAVCGSVGLDVVDLLHALQRSPKRLPLRYRCVAYWLTRLMTALLAGLMAIAFQAQSAAIAMNIGVLAPAIIRGLATRGVGSGTNSAR